jgi:hypothetical protein
VKLTGTAEGDSTVNIYEDNVLIGKASANGVGAWSFATSVPSAVTHNFTATDTNAASNTSASAAPLSVTVSLLQTDVSTSLVEVANKYFYLENSGGSGAALRYNGGSVTAGQFGSWTPIGAVQTASGYDVAWKNSSTGLYTVWTTDTNGNYSESLTGGSVSGVGYALESIEPIFHQDLNGDGVIGLYGAPETTLQISTSLTEPTGAVTIGTGATLELGAADTSAVTFQGPTGMLRVDHSSTFGGKIFNFTGSGLLSNSDQVDLRDVKYASAHESFANGLLTVADAAGDVAKLAFNGSYTVANFKLASDSSGAPLFTILLR